MTTPKLPELPNRNDWLDNFTGFSPNPLYVEAITAHYRTLREALDRMAHGDHPNIAKAALASTPKLPGDGT